ncbi:hypothetical protein LLG96_19985 [bacterium]|nr:hypothetical protein [bacterium]
MRIVYPLICLSVVLMFICPDSFAQTPTQTQNLNDVLALIKSVEERIQALDEQQKQDVPSRIAQLEQDIAQIRNTTQTDSEVMKGFATEIRSLMSELRNNIDNSSKPGPSAQAPQTKDVPEKKASTEDFKVFWKNGICMNTTDKAFQIKFGARIMNDWTFMSGQKKVEETVGTFQDGTEFRRAWIQCSGIIYNNLEFNALYGLNGGKVDILDVYAGLRDIPAVGNVRIGHFKEPIGMEQLTSSNDITFIERSFSQSLNPFRDTGIMLFNTVIQKRATWALGAFRETDSYGNGTGKGKYNYTARLTGLPVFAENGKILLHVGASYSYRNPLNDQVVYKSRPETHIGPQFVDTGNLKADNVGLINGELGGVYGRGSVQGEYIRSGVEMKTGADADFSSFYIMGSFFLTHNSRAYKQANGAFGGAVMTENNYYGNGGYGAWELAVRYSKIDLTDGEINGGEANDITFGVNWYLNSNARVMLNYIRSDLEDIGKANAFIMRFQINI